ncbi:hypothetical protein WAF17_10660 [Bernardetia sp. ABR2-2B]
MNLIVEIIIYILAVLVCLIIVAMLIDSIIIDFMPKKIQDWWEHRYW